MDKKLKYLAQRHFRLEEISKLDFYYYLLIWLEKLEKIELTLGMLKSICYLNSTRYKHLLRFLYLDNLITKKENYFVIDDLRCKEILGNHDVIPF